MLPRKPLLFNGPVFGEGYILTNHIDFPLQQSLVIAARVFHSFAGILGNRNARRVISPAPGVSQAVILSRRHLNLENGSRGVVHIEIALIHSNVR